MSNVVAINKEVAAEIESQAKQSVSDMATELVANDAEIKAALKARILSEISDPKIDIYWKYNDSYKALLHNVINDGEVWQLVRDHYVAMLGDTQAKKDLLDSAAYEIGQIIVSELREAK